jgi:DNA-binding NarL/FixJ family response regulator
MPQIDALVLGGGMYPGYEQYWSAVHADPQSALPFAGRPASEGEIEYARFAAIRVVATGQAVAAPSVTKRLIEHFVGGTAPPTPEAHRLDVLTSREREVLTLIARGLSNSEIAAMLVVSESTVKTHVNRILAKLGLRDRIQAVILGYQAGLVGNDAS